MDIPEFVPTLAELIDANEDWGFQCWWHNQKKGNQNVKRCGNTVRGRDVGERDGLIDRLRVLIRSAPEAATLAPATPDSIPEILETLGKVSMWLLCKGKHRKYSNKVLVRWSDELDKVEEATDHPATDQSAIDQPATAQPATTQPATDQPATAQPVTAQPATAQPATAQPATDQSTTYDVREKLGIDNGEELLCHAKKKDGTRCKQPISAKNRDHANDIIADLAKPQDSSSTTQDRISLLAQLLICQHKYHRDQVTKKSEEWSRKIQELSPPADAVPEQPSTPPFRRTTTVDIETPRSTASSIFSRASSIATSTPPTSPPSQRRYYTRPTDSGSPLRSRSTNNITTTIDDEQQYLSHLRVTRRTTFERQAGLLTPEPVYPSFRPLSPKNGSEYLTNLYNLITRAFKKRDGTPGHLYGFKRDGADYIKVGFTKFTVEHRMKEWRTQCNQRLTVVLEKYVPHAGKMESLVHATLYNQRRRESLVNGACNGGIGCHKKHKEWLEVTLELLQEVVDRWIRWFECIPYDKQGCLKSEWAELIFKLRKEQKKPLPDLWQHWIDVTRLAEGTTDEVKTEVADDKSTLAFDAKEKMKNAKELKPEFDDKVTAYVLDRSSELRHVNRRYNEALIEIKNETPDEIPLSELPMARQDLSLHLNDDHPDDDPFITSTDTTAPT